MASIVGTHIGAYKIERQLGRGGFGIVYVGIDTRLGRRAAIKQLLPELSGHRTIVERFFNEAKAAANINHPGIVEIYDVGWHTDGSAYFAMKLLDGDSLAKRLKSANQLPITLAATIGRQVASALGAAHAAGIVHRDLKPDNVILVPDEEIVIGERAVILDFGIAKLTIENATSHTRSGMMMGTPKYMSPEQCKGAGEVDHRTDIYALGCILYEMLTGQVPFIGEGPGEIMGMHQFVDVPAMRSLRPDLPAELETVVMKLLAKKLDQRTQQMSELQAALQKFGTGGKAPPAIASRRPQTDDEAMTEPFYVLPENTDTAYHLPKDPVSVAAKAALAPPRTAREAEAPPTDVPRRPAPDAPKDRTYSPSVVRGEIDVPDPPRSRRTLFLVLGGAALLGIVIAIAVGTGGSRLAVPDAPDAAIVIAVDAANPKPVVVPDDEVVITTPSPDIAKLTTECAMMLADRSWPKLSDCGKALTKAGGDGAEFVAKAVDEAKAEVSLRKIGEAIKRLDIKEAERFIGEIAGSSTYHGDAQKAVEDLHGQLVASNVADLNTFANQRNCAKYNERLASIRSSMGQTIVDLSKAKAKKCEKDSDTMVKKPCNGECQDGQECKGNKCVAKTVPPNQCADVQVVADIEAKADAALVSGSFAQSLTYFEQILRCKPTLQLKAYMAACKARNFVKAKIYFRGLKENLAQLCMMQGFDPR